MSEPGQVSGERAMDSQAFEALVRQHHRRLLGYALALMPVRQVAEDLVQETFLTAYREMARFETDRDFGAWARGILRNKYREWARRQREIPTDVAVLAAVDEQHALWDRVETATGELLGVLQECIRKLPEVLRQVVDLFYLQRKPGAEVAGQVDLVVTTIGLPQDAAKMEFWHMPSRPKLALANGSVYELKRAFKTGAIVAAVTYSPRTGYHDRPAPKTMEEYFAERFLLITPGSIDEISRQFPELFLE